MQKTKVPVLSEEQRAAVCARRNSVVSAGAGSGKTTVLAERYFALLEEGRAGVENILTLTFTRKAAAEMHERIYRRLKLSRNDDAILRQLEEFDKAGISTLDSFCASVLRGAANRYGLSPSFSLDEAASEKLLADFSLRFLLENQERQSLLQLTIDNGFEAVLSGFTRLASGYFVLGVPRDFRAMHDEQMRVISRKLEEAALRGAALLRGILAIEAGGKGASEEALMSLQKELASLGEPEALAREMHCAEFRAVLGKVEKQRKPGRTSSVAVTAFKEAIEEARKLCAEFDGLLGTLQKRELLEELYGILDEFQARVEAEKRLSGILTFADCAGLAVRALTEDGKLRNYYKKKYRAVMIDEFQDNNSLQKELLYLLAEKEGMTSEGIPRAEDLDREKLFFVGDEKQSIYRFRGADVRVFKGLAEELASSGGELIRLDTNYRS
ncbi:MAG: UvrD-helicase domain-containing protein, partial [Spirochaetales bacterium]|nr:UvrD-helicase domain-containing protein [Spirochaetales bacterium]